MKKILLILIIALFFGVQWKYASQIQFFTLHDRGQRKMIAALQENYKVLSGNIDEHLKFRHSAIYRIRVIGDRECYVVFVQEVQKKQELIQLYDAANSELLYSSKLLPYRIDDTDATMFRGVLDLDLDGNLEIAVTVRSKAGKRLRIFSIQELKIRELPLSMAENYALIKIEDLNHDGRYEIIAQTSLNGLLQVPEIFHYHDQSLIPLELKDYPSAIREYEKYLQNMEKQLPSQKGLFELQWMDIELSRILMYLSLDQKDAFQDKLEKLQAIMASDMDPSKRLRYYRSRIYQAYSLLLENQTHQAKMLIEEAIRELQESIHFRTNAEIESLVLTEIAGFHRWKRNLQQCKHLLNEALRLNPYNMIAKGFLESYFLDDD